MKNKYGQKPKTLGIFTVESKEMMFYQYLPIKLAGTVHLTPEKRLLGYDKIILSACLDYMNTFGREAFTKSYVYVTVKNLYQHKNGNSFNREGWHSDGFLTDDVNYIWSDKAPTVFNLSDFNIRLDDALGMKDMNDQAMLQNNVTYMNNMLLRLNQYVIHKVGEMPESGMRQFVKVSISRDKYDLLGNSVNYDLEYNWDMKPRKEVRNVPQSKIT